MQQTYQIPNILKLFMNMKSKTLPHQHILIHKMWKIIIGKFVTNDIEKHIFCLNRFDIYIILIIT